MRQSFRFLLVMLWIAFIFAGATDGQEPKATTQESAYSLNEVPEKDFELWGPEAAKFVIFDPAGMRITLPTGYPKLRPAVGLSSSIVIMGDFEITVSFAILNEPEATDAGDFGTRLALTVGLDTARESLVKFTRAVRAEKGREFIAFSSRWQGPDAKHQKRSLPIPGGWTRTNINGFKARRPTG